MSHSSLHIFVLLPAYEKFVGFLERPEDVKNEFVAVGRGKSWTNPDYNAAFVWVVLNEWLQSLANGRGGGLPPFWQLFPISLIFRWPETRAGSVYEIGI